MKGFSVLDEEDDINLLQFWHQRSGQRVDGHQQMGLMTKAEAESGCGPNANPNVTIQNTTPNTVYGAQRKTDGKDENLELPKNTEKNLETAEFSVNVQMDVSFAF